MEPPILLDFDGVYAAQDFYRESGGLWLHRGFLPGAGACCSPRAASALRRRLARAAGPALCFFGSGNYHYLCLFRLERIRREFALLLFDHHSDCRPPAFGRMLSCGSWVREALRTLPNLRRVVWAGAVSPAPPGLPAREKWAAVPRGAAGRPPETPRVPVYVSVDKDIFDPGTARTNWDQGDWTTEDFSRAFAALTAGRPLLGMDVCGEFPERYGSPAEFRAASRRNDAANRRLLELWRRAAPGRKAG